MDSQVSRLMPIALVMSVGCHLPFNSNVIQAPTREEIALSAQIETKCLAGSATSPAGGCAVWNGEISDEFAKASLAPAEYETARRKDLRLAIAYASPENFCRNIMLYGQKGYNQGLLLG